MKNKLGLYHSVLIASFLFGALSFAKAEDIPATTVPVTNITNPATTPVATPAATPSGPTVTFGGGIDTYYMFNTDSAHQHSLGGMVPMPVTSTIGVFNRTDNAFQIGLAKLSVDGKEGKASGHIDLIYGQDADLIASSSTTSVLIENAVVNYTPNSKLTLTMGKFATPIGFEVIESWSNLNYSRSFIFGYTTPFENAGLKAAYAISDKYSALIMVANSSWVTPEASSMFKNGLLQFTGNPSSKFGFIATALFGENSSNVHTTQNVADLDINANPTSKIYVGLDLTYGQLSLPDVSVDATKSDIKPYNGAALYASYAISGAFKLAARVERMNDKDGVTGIPAPSLQDGTLTLSYKTGNFLPRLEYRYDEGRDGANKLLGTQRTYTLSTAYTF